MLLQASNDGSIGMIITLVILVVLFIVLREYICWYWKINKRIDQLDDIKNALNDIIRRIDQAEADKNRKQQ